MSHSSPTIASSSQRTTYLVHRERRRVELSMLQPESSLCAAVAPQEDQRCCWWCLAAKNWLKSFCVWLPWFIICSLQWRACSVQDSEVGLGRHDTGVNEKFNRKSHHPTQGVPYLNKTLSFLLSTHLSYNNIIVNDLSIWISRICCPAYKDNVLCGHHFSAQIRELLCSWCLSFWTSYLLDTSLVKL